MRATNVWIRTSDGELVAGDCLLRLRQVDGTVRAMCPDGTWVSLAGPGCVPDFHLQLLSHVARARRLLDDRWITVVAAAGSGKDTSWTCVNPEDPGDAGSKNALPAISG